MRTALQSFLQGRETSQIPSRDQAVNRLQGEEQFDLLIIGGGSCGTGAALDATTRGLNTACVERYDFGEYPSGIIFEFIF